MRWIHYHATLPVFFDKADSKATRLGAKRPKWVGESFPHAPQGLSRSDWGLKCMKGGLTFWVSLNVFSSFRLQRVQPDYRIGARMALR